MISKLLWVSTVMSMMSLKVSADHYQEPIFGSAHYSASWLKPKYTFGVMTFLEIQFGLNFGIQFVVFEDT